MKKTVVILVGVFLLNTFLFSQEHSDLIRVEISEKNRLDRHSYAFIFCYKNDSGVSLIRRYRTKGAYMPFFMERYDNNMNLINSNELDLKYEVHVEKKGKIQTSEFKRDVLKPLILGGKLYLFTVLSEIHRNNKSDYLYLETINTDSLQVNKDVKKLCEVSKEKKKITFSSTENWPPKYEQYEPPFNIKISKDSSKVLVFYKLFSDEKDKQTSYIEMVHVYDKDMKLLWQKEIELPYSNKNKNKYEVDFEIDNNGNIHYLLKYADSKFLTDNPQTLYSYYYNDDVIKEYPIKTSDKDLFLDIKLATNKGGDIICGGFVYKFSDSKIYGSYYLKIDNNLKDKSVEKVIQIDLKELYQQDGNLIKLPFYHKYKLKDFIIKDDGEVVFITEQEYSSMGSTRQVNSGQTSTDDYIVYHHDEILVVQVSSEGDFEWVKKINKDQAQSKSSFLLSYKLLLLDGKLNFIFNDDEKNINRKEKELVDTFFGTSNSALVFVQLDNFGNQSKKELIYKMSDFDCKTMIETINIMSNKEVLVRGIDNKTERFATVTFK